MKKYLLIFAAIMFGVIAFTGCKKDKDKTEDLSNLTEMEKKLVGKWDLQITSVNGEMIVVMDGSYLIVKADHSYTMGSEEEGEIESGSWSLKDKIITRTKKGGDKAELEIVEVTSTKLTLKDLNTPVGYTIIYYFEN